MKNTAIQEKNDRKWGLICEMHMRRGVISLNSSQCERKVGVFVHFVPAE